MDVSENTPVGDVRRAVANNAFPISGDAVKVALAMIDSIEIDAAPLRLPLGSDTYTLVRGALQQRLAALDAQKDIAFSAVRILLQPSPSIPVENAVALSTGVDYSLDTYF